MNKATAWTLDEPPVPYEKDYYTTIKLGPHRESDEPNSIRAAARQVSRSCRDTGYMAVSHVWSDGTGSGRNPGTVNSCLFDWFRQMAKTLGCDGIWWDAICIPNDKNARRAAINKMHEFYQGAKVTIVHDEYLLNFKWADDGSPCLALALSPWFSRGWTALELNMSKRVKVLFKNPDETSSEAYVIKDLIEDILPTSYATQGHKYAGAVIIRVMQNILSVNDIIWILKTRSTSWTRDRIIIAALLTAGMDLDSSLSETQITCAIVTQAGKLNPSFLLHGHSTIKEHGAFSWCPSNLFHGEVPMRLTKLGPQSSLYVTRPNNFDTSHSSTELPGDIVGVFNYRLVREADLQLLNPFSLHASVDWRIWTALQNHNTCLLLRHQDTDPSSPSILVTVLGTGFINGPMSPQPWSTEKAVLDCEFVGAVYDDSSEKYCDKTLCIRMGSSELYSEPEAFRAKVIKGPRTSQASSSSNESAEDLISKYTECRYTKFKAS